MISSKDNQKIKNLHKLISSNSFSLENNCIVLDGLRLCSDALINNLNLLQFFYTKSFVEKHPKEYKNFIDRSLEAYEVDGNLFNKISQTQNPQGCIIVCEKPSLKFDFTKLSGKYLLLDNLSDPGNIGNIIRTAEAMGINGLICIKGCNIYSQKVIRASMGSIFRIPIFICSDYSIVDELVRNNITIISTVLKDHDISIKDYKFHDRTVCVIGNEANGVCNEIIEKCNVKLNIPMKGLAESLNVASAACILIWEMTK